MFARNDTRYDVRICYSEPIVIFKFLGLSVVYR